MPALASPQLWAGSRSRGGGILVWLLSPILAPFLFAAILAYILDPLVERLTPPPRAADPGRRAGVRSPWLLP